MKQRRLKIGILFPDNDVKWLIYSKPTKDGFVYGVSHAETHITALPETQSVSFHLTSQIEDRRKHLGRIIKEGDYEDVQLKALNPRLVTGEGLDEQVVYITRRGSELLNQSSDIVTETETDEEHIILLDILKFFNNSVKMLNELSHNIDRLFGISTARTILSNTEYEAGITSRETAIIEVEGELYEVNIKAYFDLVNKENPLQEILGPLGVHSLMPELEQRFNEVIEEKMESLKDYEFPDSLPSSD